MKTRFLLVILFTLIPGFKLNAQSITSFSAAGIYDGNTKNGLAMYSGNIAPNWYVNASGGNYDSIVLTLSGYNSGDSILIWGLNPSGGKSTNFLIRNRATNSNWFNVKTSGGANYVTYKSGMYSYGIAPGSGKTRVVFDIKTTTDGASTIYTDRLVIGVKASGATSLATSVIEFNPIIIPLTNCYRWSGAKGANWQTSSNWTPDRTTTKDSDILVIQQINDAEINIPYSGGQFKQTITSLIVSYSCSAILSNYTNGNGSAAKSILSFTNYAPTSSLDILYNASLNVGGTDSIEFHFPSSTQTGLNASGSFGTTNSLGNGARAIFSGGGSSVLTQNFPCDANTSIRFAIDEGYTLYVPVWQDSYIGGAGEVIIDKGCELTIDGSEGASNNAILNGKLSIYGTLKIMGANTTLVSNVPNSSSASDWNNWTPYLQFRNNGTKKGMLKAVDGVSVITGGVLWEIYNSGNRAWRTIGIPFKNDINLSQFSDNIVITGINSGNNKDSFNSFGANCSYCKPSAWYWDESTEAWVDYQSGNTANKIAQGSGIMLFFRGMGNNGLGNPSASATPGSIDIKGSPFLGDLTKNLSYSSSAGSLKGYNLVSNPYLCNIDFNSISKTNVADKYLIYEPKAKMYNIYDNSGSSLSLTGSSAFQSSTSTEAQTLEMGSSFFVIATNSSSSISFSESNKVTTNPKISAFKFSTDIPCNQLKTKIEYADTNNKLMDRFLLEWDMENKGASQDFDYMDLNKLYAGYLGIGSIAPSGQWLGIDRRPDLIDSAFYIPLKTKTLDTNYYTLNFQTCPNNANYVITLIDKEKNTSTNIENESNYAFTTKGKQSINSENRFAIKLEKRNTGYSKIVKNKILNLFPSPLTDNHLNCTVSGNSLIKNLNILTIDGRILFSKNNINSTFVNVEIPTIIANGIYLIEISTITNEKIASKFELLRN